MRPCRQSEIHRCGFFDRAAWDELESQPGKRGGFSGAHFGPAFHGAALAAGHTWPDLQTFAREYSDDVFISRNLETLRRRGVEMLFHPGAHDMEANDVPWGGANHGDIPVYLGANTGHGKKDNPHPNLERDNRNRDAFLLRHFFPDQVEPLLTPPVVEHQIVDNVLKVTGAIRTGFRRAEGSHRLNLRPGTG